MISIFKTRESKLWGQVEGRTLTQALLTPDFPESDRRRQLGLSDASTWAYFGTDASLMFSIQPHDLC